MLIKLKFITTETQFFIFIKLELAPGLPERQLKLYNKQLT
jgi:hypothetical protein